MTDIMKYGYNNIFERQITEEEKAQGLIPARVISVQKENYQLVSAMRENNAKLKGSIFYQDSAYQTYPAVGDFVLIKANDLGDDIIYRVLDRRTSFSRLNPTKRVTITASSEQIVAANFDYVFIMTSLNDDFNLRRMERYLATAWQSGGIPVILLTKADLCNDISDRISEVKTLAPAIDIHAISTYTGFGMDSLSKYLNPGTTLVFLGSSGIGKSSLVNALAGEELMKVNTIREDDSKGHHTTTYRQLFCLRNGALIIDTPGMRELGIWAVEEGLGETFLDIEELSSQCRFRDCTHTTEPGCAVTEAIENGTLPRERLKSYMKLKKEALRSAQKAEFLKNKASLNKNFRKYQHLTKKHLD